MSEQRIDRPGREPRAGSESFDDDFAALRSLSAQDPPELQTSLRAAKSRVAGERREGFAMATRFLTQRPALATTLGVIVVAAALLMIPISYQRTVGYDVALTLEGANVPQQQVRDIARGFQETLGAEGATVTADMQNGRLSYFMKAEADRDVRESANAFAKELKALGYDASVVATPRRETVSTNLYAYAMSQVIEIQTDGKSAAQLESEIRSRLQAAGVTEAQVSVREVGEGGREVKIEARDINHAGEAHVEVPEVVLTKDGKPIAGGDMVRVMKKKDASGSVTLVVAVTSGGKSATVEVPTSGSMSDAAIAAEIQSKLLAAGIDAVVTVQGDHITVEKREK